MGSEGPATLEIFMTIAPSIDLDPVALLNLLTAFRTGDGHTRMPIETTGLGGRIADTTFYLAFPKAAP
jgi:hypothetical protein